MALDEYPTTSDFDQVISEIEALGSPLGSKAREAVKDVRRIQQQLPERSSRYERMAEQLRGDYDLTVEARRARLDAFAAEVRTEAAGLVDAMQKLANEVIALADRDGLPQRPETDDRVAQEAVIARIRDGLLLRTQNLTGTKALTAIEERLREVLPRDDEESNLTAWVIVGTSFVRDVAGARDIDPDWIDPAFEHVLNSADLSPDMANARALGNIFRQQVLNLIGTSQWVFNFLIKQAAGGPMATAPGKLVS